MTEYSIKIMNLRDLIKFEKYVYANHLQGKIRQCNYTDDIHSILGIAIAIPMDSATVSLKDCPESLADGFPLLCQ